MDQGRVEDAVEVFREALGRLLAMQKFSMTSE